MAEELGFQESAKFTRYEVVVNKDLRSPFLDDLEEIGPMRSKRLSELLWSIDLIVWYCCVSTEFYYDFPDMPFNGLYFELSYMNTDLFYFAMSGYFLHEIIKSEI